MRFFSSWSQVVGGLLGVSVVAASFAACGGEVDTHYGPPSGLTGKSPPLPSGGSGDSGTGNPPVTTGDGGKPNALCGGNGPVDGGACAVSWKTNIYAKMGAVGAWKCADANCHGTFGGNPPYIMGSNSHADYVALTVAKITAKPYLNPCSTDPAQSTIACNVGATAPLCGLGPMPFTTNGATPLTAAEKADLMTWVASGSPEN